MFLQADFTSEKSIFTFIAVALMVAIVAIIIIWLINQSRETFVKLPREVKCFIEHRGCEENNITGSILLYGLFYLGLGLIFPNRIGIILLALIATEVVMAHFSPNYIVRPLIGLTGYGIGWALSDRLQSCFLKH